MDALNEITEQTMFSSLRLSIVSWILSGSQIVILELMINISLWAYGGTDILIYALAISNEF